MTDVVPFDAEQYLATWHLNDNGQFEQVLITNVGSERRPALFLDRDGVIVEDTHHLSRPEDVEMITGAAEVIAAANIAGIPVIVVTNQSGVGQGLFTWSDFLAVQVRILSALAYGGARIDAVFACPNHPDAAPPWGHPDHPWRKPNPGMLLRGAACLPVDLGASWIVGDRWRDLEAGRRAGLAGGLYVGGDRTGEVAEEAVRDTMAKDTAFAVRQGTSIADAAALPPFTTAMRFTNRETG